MHEHLIRHPILAVTDFRNITANADDDWLGTGISETVTADLEGFEGVTVVPRGRVSELVRTIARERGDQNERFWIRVGRELGARWVLTGSFQRAAAAVRVTAYLLDAATANVEFPKNLVSRDESGTSGGDVNIIPN